MTSSPLSLSCTDFTFPRLRHKAALELIRAMDFTAVDLCLVSDRSHLTAAGIRNDPLAAAREVRAHLDALGLSVADVLFVPSVAYAELALNHPSADNRREWGRLFESALSFASEVGAAGMTILPGPVWPEEPRETLVQRSVDELQARIEQGASAGVLISAEPHLGSYMESPDDVRAAIEEFPDLRITLDYAHFVYEGTSIDAVHPLMAHARHVHLRGANPGRLQAKMEDNTIDFRAVLGQAQRDGFSGHFSCEYVWFKGEGAYAHCDECDCVSETVLLAEMMRTSAA